MDQYNQVTSTKFDAIAEFCSNSASTYILLAYACAALAMHWFIICC